MFDTVTGQSRGYAFVEFEREKDMKVAYKEAGGLRLEGRRMLVDVERGRTVKGWKPTRLGGGLGSKRDGKMDPRERREREREKEREKERERSDRDRTDRLGPKLGSRDRGPPVRESMPRDPRDRSSRDDRPPRRRSRSPRRDR